MLRRVFLVLALLCGVQGDVGAINCSPCAVNSFVRYDLYVSNVSYGGIPVGDDTTGDGSVTNPFLTPDRALQQVLTGSQVFLNGNPSSPAVYTTSANLVAGTYSIKPVNDYGAILAGAGATQALTLGLDMHVTLGKIIVDPSQNSGGPAAVCINFINSLQPITRMSLTLLATKFQNWTSTCVNSLGAIRAVIAFTDVIFNGGNVDAAIFLNAMASGATFTWTGGSCTITAQKATVIGGCIYANVAGAATGSVTITNVTANMTLDPTLTGAGLHYAVRLTDVPAATISGGTYNVLGAPGSRQGAGIMLSNVSNDISGSTVSNVNVTNTTNGGYGCGAGNESITGAPTSSVTFTNCNVTGNAVSGAGGLHCHFLGGNTQNSTFTGGTVTTCGLLGAIKLSTGNTITGVTGSGWYTSAAWVAKGATNPTITNNTGTQTVASVAPGLYLEDDTPGSGTHTTNATVSGNHIINAGSTGLVYMKVDPSNTFAATYPQNDTYEYISGTDATNKFVVGATNYTTCAAYKAAQETTATCVNLP